MNLNASQCHLIGRPSGKWAQPASLTYANDTACVAASSISLSFGFSELLKPKAGTEGRADDRRATWNAGPSEATVPTARWDSQSG